MKIIAFVLAEKTINNPFYVYEDIRNTDKCRIYYLFRSFVADCIQNVAEQMKKALEIIESEKVNILKVDEYTFTEENNVFYHSDETVICVDRKNFQDFYIALEFHRNAFEKIAINCNYPSQQDFVEALKQDKYGSFKIDRKNFFEVLKEWEVLFAAKSPYILLYQDDQYKVELKSFESLDQAEKFIIDSMGEEEFLKTRTPESYK